jgi:hypothetical protein
MTEARLDQRMQVRLPLAAVKQLADVAERERRRPSNLARKLILDALARMAMPNDRSATS